MLQKVITMAKSIRTFRDLEVWQAGMDLSVAVYSQLKLPAEERFGLTAQIRRAAVSIPSNIAEGHAFRTKPRAFRRHVRIALGSFAELETQVELLSRLQMADDRVLKELGKKLTRTGQLLHGLLRALRAIRETDRS